jgi:hypothetical protein
MSNLQFLLGGEDFRVRALPAHMARDRLSSGPRAQRFEVQSAVSAQFFQLFRMEVGGPIAATGPDLETSFPCYWPRQKADHRQ